MLTDKTIARIKALDEERALKRIRALTEMEARMKDEKNQLAVERAKAGWEKRRADGTATLSAAAKDNIRIGMRDNHQGKKLVAERMKRLEEKHSKLGFSDDEIRSM
jgi:hypothetical protein